MRFYHFLFWNFSLLCRRKKCICNRLASQIEAVAISRRIAGGSFSEINWETPIGYLSWLWLWLLANTFPLPVDWRWISGGGVYHPRAAGSTDSRSMCWLANLTLPLSWCQLITEVQCSCRGFSVWKAQKMFPFGLSSILFKKYCLRNWGTLVNLDVSEWANNSPM